MPQWIQVDIGTTTAGLEPLGAVLLDMGLGYSVQDAADFESFLRGEGSHWDYIDDEVMKLQTAPTVVTVYLSDKEQGVGQLAVLTRELDRLKFLASNREWGALTYTLKGVEEEAWATAWKQYYKPIHISPRLSIVPQWIDYTPRLGEQVVKMDPGMAFGTGTHESTRLCLEFLDEIAQGGEEVLDIGAGSGILSIAALLLGGTRGVGVDIDQVAVEVAGANADQNGLGDRLEYRQGHFTDNVVGTFDIIFANIVADAIKTLAPSIPHYLKRNGFFITSGIIQERSSEVEEALKASGLHIVSRKEEGGWVAFCAQKGEVYA